MKMIRIALAACVPFLFVACQEARQALGEAIEKAREDGGSEADAKALVRDLGEADYSDFTSREGVVVVVDFHAPWCGTCKLLGPRLEAATKEFEGDVLLGKLNVDEAGGLAGQLGVRTLPEVRIFRGGVMVDRFVGVRTEDELKEILNRQVVRLGNGIRQRAAEGEEQGERAIKPMTEDWMPPGVEKL